MNNPPSDPTRPPAPAHFDLRFRLASIHLYPIKSCAGLRLDEALLIETGLELDRAWMVVDADGVFVTQRTQPRMALIKTRMRHDRLELRAPGMLTLHIDLDSVPAVSTEKVRIWRDIVDAYDMGPTAQQWFTDYLGQRLRLVRFDPNGLRPSDTAWTSGIPAQCAFADGYALLVASQASLDDVNLRLARIGAAPVTMERFRPNLVLEGLEAYQEDELDELRFETEHGPIVIKLVKPCVRCAIRDVDPETAAEGRQPNALLATYRGNARVGGGVTFGMNAIVVDGIERALQAGADGTASFRF